MADPKRAPLQTSLLVHPPGVVLWLCLCTLCALFHKTALSLFFGFVFLLSLCARGWASAALKRVSCTLRVPVAGCYPGQEVRILRSIRNDKLLPLVWLELMEPVDPAGCACPAERYLVRNPDASPEEAGPSGLCLHRFSLLKWYQTLEFTDVWQARRRGVHTFTASTLRSGDGFGLCSVRHTVPARGRIVVYPAPVEVSVDRILNDIWDSRSSSTGYLEDPSLLKSVRDYAPSDPARRINQRLLARGQGLKVNQYEAVTPDSVLFLLDCASFGGQEPEVFEEALSILASLITGLSGRGIRTGLVTPATTQTGQSMLFPAGREDGSAPMLERLAEAEAGGQPLERFSPPPAEAIGQVYCIVYDAASAPEALLSLFAPNRLRVLCCLDKVPNHTGFRVRSLGQYRRAQ